MVITVQCPECSASFPVDPAKIPVGGVKVRCSACASIFRVERPEEVAPPPPPPPEPEPEPEPTFETPVFEAPELPEEPVDDAVAERYASETDFSVGVDAPASAETPTESDDDWVFETEEDIDPGSLDIEPVGTVQESMEEAREESSFFGGDTTFETNDMGGEAPAAPVEEAPAEPELAPVEEMPEPEPEPAPSPPPVTGFTFGKRDPHDKARRLARVLVSDIITYNPDRHARALEEGTLKENFEDEIEKSWKEYVEQVGDEIAGTTTYWTDALNDVLAKGQQVF